MTDLDKLIEAAENGENLSFWRDWKTEDGRMLLPFIADRAHEGSLDAAKALHEALLPGWGSRRLMSAHGAGFSAEVFPGTLPQTGRQFVSSHVSEARAWLIAVLKAYRAQQP